MQKEALSLAFEEVELDWRVAYRIIPSCFPPINFFEDMVSPELMDAVFELESRTNDRIRNEIGEISLVSIADRISGAGSSPIMAAFTHIGPPSRFTDGKTFGVFYAGKSKQTAIFETRYHREKFLSYTSEEPGVISMRCYSTKPVRPMIDIRQNNDKLYDPDDYSESQKFGRQMKAEKRHGIVYRSVRHPGNDCIAALRTRAIAHCKQSTHYEYHWNGKKIEHVIEKIKVQLRA